ncbi:MAG: hypothetical protein HKL80_09265 [Acidimicrobiales bacterium]|nr:hypothetical protein [Acidimicrobiales bacterium]
MACTVYNPLSWAGCPGTIISNAASGTFNQIAASFGSAADNAINWLWGQIGSATSLQLGGPGFDQDIAIVAAIAGVVAVGLFLIQVIQSVLRRDPGGLGRGVKGLFIAFIGGGVAIGVVNLLLSATDSLSQGVVQAVTGSNIAGLGRLIIGTGALSWSTGSPAGLLVISVAVIIAVTIVYATLVIRKLLIVVTAVFAPIAFAGSLADITVSWTRKWIEMTAALIFSKLILVLILVIGYGILIQGIGQNGTGVTQTFTQVVAGILVLTLAGFAPWMALKMVHFTGDHAMQLHALGTTAVAGGAATHKFAQKAASVGMAASTGGGSLAMGSTGGTSASRVSTTPTSSPPSSGSTPSASSPSQSGTSYVPGSSGSSAPTSAPQSGQATQTSQPVPKPPTANAPINPTV